MTILPRAALGVGLLMLYAATASAQERHLQEHMGPNSEAKCRAFHEVTRHARALQAAHPGVLPARARRRLTQELSAAQAMAPRRLTARKCGVPL